jgi:hypothetical protein
MSNKNISINFCTFSDTLFSPNIERIKREAEELNIFDNIFTFSEESLDESFKSKFIDKLTLNTRGYGYWVWKPYLILQTLNKLNDGDVLLYADTGCTLNKEGKTRLYEYVDIVSKSKSGILASQLLDINKEKYFTKTDLFDYFNVMYNDKVVETPQVAATIILLRKDTNTIGFLNEWYKVYTDNFWLVDDTESNIPNAIEFVEHRHDQSVFSILCKLRGAELIPFHEVWVENSKKDMHKLKFFPIWCTRIKKRSLKGALWWMYDKTVKFLN